MTKRSLVRILEKLVAGAGFHLGHPGLRPAGGFAVQKVASSRLLRTADESTLSPHPTQPQLPKIVKSEARGLRRGGMRNRMSHKPMDAATKLFTILGSWLRGPDLNRRPSGYEPDELPGCSTPRQEPMNLWGFGRRVKPLSPAAEFQ